jgi:hypothetical protein
MIRFTCFLAACLMLTNFNANADEYKRVVNSHGQLIGSARVVGGTIYYRDTYGRYTGKVSIGNRVIQIEKRRVAKP